MSGAGKEILLRGPPAQYHLIIADWYYLSRITYNYFSFYEIDGANSNWHFEILTKLSSGEFAVVRLTRQVELIVGGLLPSCPSSGKWVVPGAP